METMTKERLEAYRNNKTEILSLKYILNNRWQSETMIGNDVILDYSKGYPIPQSIIGFDQEKYERLQERDLKRKERLEKECEEVEKFVEDIEDTQLHSIFRMYYIDGVHPVNQMQVAEQMHLERSTISKKIDKYLQLSHKSHVVMGAWDKIKYWLPLENQTDEVSIADFGSREVRDNDEYI